MSQLVMLFDSNNNFIDYAEEEEDNNENQSN